MLFKLFNMFIASEFLLSLLSRVVDSKEKLQINLGIHKVKSGHKCDVMY